MGGRTTAVRTDEALWRQIVAEVTAGDKGGRVGQWSARKAQMAVTAYKAAGGGYIGPKSADNSLAKWTREKWRTKSGAPSLQTGERYLPSAAIEALTDEEYAETSRAKRSGMKRGNQFVPQPIEIAAKVAPYRRGRRGNNTETPPRDACLPSDLLLRKVSVLNKPERQNMARKKRQHTPSGRTTNGWFTDLTHYATFGLFKSSAEIEASQRRYRERVAAEAAEAERQRQERASYAAQAPEEPGTEQGRGLRPGGYKDQQAAVSEQERARIYAEQARAAELGKQQAIAAAWRQAEANAQVERNRRQREAQIRQQPAISPAKFAVSAPTKFAVSAPTKTAANMKGRRSNPASVREKISLLNKPERQNMARKYRRHNPSMRAAYADYDPYNQSASEFAAAQQASESQAEATRAAQERAMAEYNREQRAYDNDEVGGTRARIDHAREQQARQQEADRQIAYERQQRDIRRGEELGKQQAIADAYRFAAGNAQAQRQGQMTRQAIQDSAKPRAAAFGAPSRVSAQSVTFAQRAPMNLPKVGGGMKGRTRNGDFDWIPDWMPGTEGLRIETTTRPVGPPPQYHRADAGGGYVDAEMSLRPYQRQQELAQQQAIADAWNRAAGNAQAQRQGQVGRQSVAASAQQRTAAYASGPTLSAQRGPSAQRAPMNLPKVGAGMKGRKRNPATLTNADFHSINIGGHECAVCGKGATDRKGQHKYLVAVFHGGHDGADYEVQALTHQSLKSMIGSMRPLKVPRGFESAFRRFKQQCEALVGGAAARANNPGHEAGFWDAHGGDAAYHDRHAILKKALKGEWQPVSRTEIIREVRDKRGHVDDNRVRRLLSSYRAKVDSLAERCMRAEHSGKPFPMLEAKYEAAQLDLEDVQALVQELSEGRTRNPRVHHGADLDNLAGGTVVMRPVRKGRHVRREREDIVAELVALGSKRPRGRAR